MSENTVAILTPFHRPALTAEEKIAYRHLTRFLGAYDRYALIPEGLSLPYSDVEKLSFPRQHFQSRQAYSRLLLSPRFYEKFTRYRYLLLYQLDCLVFSSDLEHWCSLGYDYIGAPLFHDTTDPAKGFSRVGNGGLSLRRVDTFLKVLASTRIPPWKEVLTAPLPDLHHFPSPLSRLLKRLKVIRQARRGVRWYTAHYTLNEDLFWSDRARLFYPAFKIAPIEIGLRFAFEAHPRYCFEQNNRQPPFGAHAWTKWDRAFWEPFLTNSRFL